jgi:FtsP/CotA-like multicopper oxidase with cupredoxin domain
MKRRSFLLLAGAGLFAPRTGGMREILDDAGRAGRKRTGGALCRAIAVRPATASGQLTQTALAGADIPKYIDPLPKLGEPRVSAVHVTVTIEEFQQYVLPRTLYAGLLPPFRHGTFVWGYNVGETRSHYPGFTIEARRGVSTRVTYSNDLPFAPRLQKYLTVDQTLHWAEPLQQMGSFSPYIGPPPVVTHLHGGAVPSEFDGNPDAWFTPGLGITGPGFSTNSYAYPNVQEATTLWFHDHVLGMTRLNLYAGLAAFYLIRDSYDTGIPGTGLRLPAGRYEIEMVIQDRQFDTNGQWFFPAGNPAGLNGTPPNPAIHPFWIPEFFGDAIVVNGKTWPYLELEPRRYRLRLLNASNARFLELRVVNTSSNQPGPPLWQIGTDGGLLDRPVKLSNDGAPGAQTLSLAPAERADVIVDFAGSKGQTLVLLNTANAPFPSGDPPDPETNGQVMQFRVNLRLRGVDLSFDPALPDATLRGGLHGPPPIMRLVLPEQGTIAPKVTISRRRQLILNEIEGGGSEGQGEDGETGPIEVLINNTKWNGKREDTDLPIPGFKPDGRGNWVSELPQLGSTELWEIINLTEDAHPIHVHLVQFQLLNRQKIDADRYQQAWSAAFPGGALIPGYGPPRAYNTPNEDFAVGGNLAISPFLTGKRASPDPNEAGWKDTVRALPGEVTRIVVRWAPTDVPVSAVTAGINLYPFDPTTGPGYVWHCHVLDHEDNDMMRPYSPTP